MKDTIAAISTPLGIGGIGIVRVSGNDAISIVDKIFKSKNGVSLLSSKSYKIHYGFIVDDQTGEAIDEVLVSVMKGPRSYTCEDIVEINCHSGYLTLSRTLNLLLSKGARLANPGEFTMRAFLNGRIDLSQAEAVMDLINAKTDYARKISLSQLEGRLQVEINNAINQLTDIMVIIEAYIDFPEDDLSDFDKITLIDKIKSLHDNLQRLSSSFDEGRFLREGLAISIIGKPNVGKSSLLNRLLMRDRAIVTDLPGTTRDIIEECINIKGLPVKIIDTAGIRNTLNKIEIEGIKRSMKAIETSDIVLAVFDHSLQLSDEDFKVIENIRGKKSIVVLNKCDINTAGVDKKAFENLTICEISALTGMGIEKLKETIFNLAVKNDSAFSHGDFMITNERHKILIDDTILGLENAYHSINSNLHLEIISMYIRECIDYLGEIVGRVSNEEIINRIFTTFCIGK
ncbi:MAG: tRNA uridine-5-carboxymethylaminomethyl(34) synthesis GTPase MnmE [Thermodesulfovibrionales bacterium]|nr:tRNA uridine-5-carboxymethylaminomethyl(34) synthesis GTPase MnmE [Thermodesulfovibrionales bacterium]